MPSRKKSLILDRQRAVKNKFLLPDHTVSRSQGRMLVIQLLFKSPVELSGSNSLPLLFGPTLSANHNSLFENAQRKSQSRGNELEQELGFLRQNVLKIST
jgi:hypothetical protein